MTEFLVMEIRGLVIDKLIVTLQSISNVINKLDLDCLRIVTVS